ncbi:MAG: hypothetical protein AAF436_09000 [Myxococcota bacterium]
MGWAELLPKIVTATLLGALSAASGCSSALTTDATATPSTSLVCLGEDFTVTLMAGLETEVENLIEDVQSGSPVGGLDPNQPSPSQSYTYSYFCDDPGRIEIDYYADEGSRSQFRTKASLDCEICIPEDFFEGATGGGEIAAFNTRLPNGSIASVTVQAGNIESIIYDHQGGFIDFTTGELDDVAVAETDSGRPAAALAGSSTNTDVAVDEGDGFSETTTVVDAPTADVTTIPDTGDGQGFGVALNDSSIWRLESSGSDWSINTERSADTSWILGCVPSPLDVVPFAIALARDFALALMGEGQLCHGLLEPTAEAALAVDVGFGAFDLKCPPDRNGDVWACAILAENELMLLAWPDESIAPTVENRVELCIDFQFAPLPPTDKGVIANPRTMGAVMPNDHQACFAAPCGNGVIEEVCVGVSELELQTRAVIELAGCGPDHVTYVNAGQIAASCDEGFQVFSRTDLEGGPGSGGTGGTNGTGGTGGGNSLEEPKLLHPCDVFTPADIEALTGAPMAETRVLDNENRRLCEYATASDNGMRIDMEAQQNTASADFYTGWQDRNSDASEVIPIPWSPQGELRIIEGGATIFAFVINDDALGRNIFINLIGFPIGDAPDSPALIRSVVETTARRLNDAILTENGRPTMPP